MVYTTSNNTHAKPMKAHLLHALAENKSSSKSLDKPTKTKLLTKIATKIKPKSKSDKNVFGLIKVKGKSKKIQKIVQELEFSIAEDMTAIKDVQHFRAKMFSAAYSVQFDQQMDVDAYDDYSIHVLVRDKNTHQIVACTRIITPKAKKVLGKYYSEQEFNLTDYLKDKKKVYELGRTCVDPSYRGGKALAELWLGMIPVIFDDLKAHHLIGCVSVNADASLEKILASQEFINTEVGHVNVSCKEPFDFSTLKSKKGHSTDLTVLKTMFKDIPLKKQVPTLLPKYKKLGARFAVQPYFDKDFNCYDYFCVLDVNKTLLLKAHVVCKLMSFKKKMTDLKKK